MHTDVGWRRMTEEVFVSRITHLVPTLTFFCERRPGLDVKSESLGSSDDLLTRNVATFATSGPNSSAMISRVMHCVLASIPLLTKIRRGSLPRFNTGFNAARFDLDDALSVTRTHSLTLHWHVPDAFGRDGKQKHIDFVEEGTVGELGPYSGDVGRKLVVGQLVNTTVVLIKVVAEGFRATP